MKKEYGKASFPEYGLEQAEFEGSHSSLSTVADTKLGENMLYMDFDGTHTYRQRASDLAVRLALCEELQHLVLARG